MGESATMATAEEQALDRELVEQCLAGNADQFRYLVRRYERVVIANLRGRLRDASAVEDAAQETFVRAYRGLRGLRSPDAFFSWLLGIADRVAREFRRRDVRRDEVAREYFERQQRAAGEPDAGPHDDINAAVATLSDPLRQVVLLRFYADRSCAEISRALGIPIGTVTKRLSRAYDRIRRRTGR